MKLKDILREIRQTKGISLREASRMTGVSNPYISQLENGIITTPSPSILRRLATAYHYPYETLMKAAGYLKDTNRDTPPEYDAIFLSAIEDLSEKEMNEVLDYMKFVRSRGKNKTRGKV